MLIVAPFARGAAHGGSLRATAMAERLEARGATVAWSTVPVVHGGARHKAVSLLRGQPAIVRTHTRRLPEIDPRTGVVIASHSYLAPVLLRAPPDARRLVDFHNLEWRVLADTGRAQRGPHGGYLRLQGRLMRRFERAVLRSGAAVTLACADELAWAAPQGVAGGAAVVPNVLTRAAVAEADRAARRRGRRGDEAGARLLYLGTLTFPPNVTALLRFLDRDWPAVRAAHPAAELRVAGRCDARTAAAIGRHPGVRALGFADDLPELLSDAAAALLPFEGRGGSSLRCLQYALARVPVVAAPAAARGLPFSPGLIAHDANAWAGAVGACLARDPAVDRVVQAAHAGARAVQDDEVPWDTLWDLLDAPAVVA